jgi:hypothetical protein
MHESISWRLSGTTRPDLGFIVRLHAETCPTIHRLLDSPQIIRLALTRTANPIVERNLASEQIARPAPPVVALLRPTATNRAVAGVVVDADRQWQPVDDYLTFLADEYVSAQKRVYRQKTTKSANITGSSSG